MMNRFAVVGAVVAVVVVAAGCSSSSKGAGSASGTGSSSSASTVASSASSATSVASSSAPVPGSSSLPSSPTLAAIVVQPADLPAGFVATPHQASPSDAADQAALVQCVGGRDTDPDQVAQANSPDYGLNGASVSSSATSYKTQADIDADVAIIHSPKIDACYQQLAKTQLASSLPAGGTIDAVTIMITPGASGGPSNVVGTGTGTVTATVSGQQVTIYLDVAFVTGPLIEAEVDFENPTQPVPAALFTSLITAVATRAAHS